MSHRCLYAQTKHWITQLIDPDIGGVITTQFGAALLMSRVDEVQDTVVGKLRAIAAASRRRAAAKHRSDKAAAHYFMSAEQQEELMGVVDSKQTLESIRRTKRKIMEVCVCVCVCMRLRRLHEGRSTRHL